MPGLATATGYQVSQGQAKSTGLSEEYFSSVFQEAVITTNQVKYIFNNDNGLYIIRGLQQDHLFLINTTGAPME